MDYRPMQSFCKGWVFPIIYEDNIESSIGDYGRVTGGCQGIPKSLEVILRNGNPKMGSLQLCESPFANFSALASSEPYEKSGDEKQSIKNSQSESENRDGVFSPVIPPKILIVGFGNGVVAGLLLFLIAGKLQDRRL